MFTCKRKLKYASITAMSVNLLATPECPLFSIVIPVHNDAGNVTTAVQSILADHQTPIEIILVENGSSDLSWEACQSLSQKYPGIVVATQNCQLGVAAARNAGLKLVKGEIVGFCDADDAYKPGVLLKIAKLFEHNTYDIIVTGLDSVSLSGKHTPMHVKETEVYSAREIQERMLYQDCIMGSVWNKFFRKELISGISFCEKLTHCEDMHFVSQILKSYPNAKVLLSSDITYEYRENPASATRNPLRLIDESGRLKYMLALDGILQLYPYDYKIWLLVRSSQFRIIEENIDQFVNLPNVIRRLVRASLNYIPAYLICRKRHPLRERWNRVVHCLKYLWVK